MSNRRIEQHAVGAEFEHLGDIAGGPYPCIDNHRVIRVIAFEVLEDDF